MLNMMTKLDVLMAICETPGWQPPEQSSSIDRSLGELEREGWILPRLDGWEASAEALDYYPHFEQHNGTITGASPAPPEDPYRDDRIPRDRVVGLVVGVLHHLPLPVVSELMAAGYAADEATLRAANELVERMRD